MKPRHDVKGTTQNLSIKLDYGKCIGCNSCVRACRSQAINVFTENEYKFYPPLISGGSFEDNWTCIKCGYCVKACPVAALMPVPFALPPDFIALVAPSARFAFCEGFDNRRKIITALRQLGARKVFDVNVGADLTTIVDTNEYLHAKEQGKLPLFTSCCPAWVNYAEWQRQDLLDHVSTAKSCVQMLAELVVEHYPDVPVVAVMPCTAKKDECLREQLKREITGVVTITELQQICKDRELDIEQLSINTCYDDPFFECSGGSYIFGRSGGVGENVLRYLCLVLKVTSPVLIDQTIYWQEKDQHVVLKKYLLKDKFFVIAIACGGTAMEKICDMVKRKEIEIDVVEQMACAGGCMNGGGMPKSKDLTARKEGMEQMDATTIIKAAGENPVCQNLMYDERRFCTYFVGQTPK